MNLGQPDDVGTHYCPPCSATDIAARRFPAEKRRNTCSREDQFVPAFRAVMTISAALVEHGLFDDLVRAQEQRPRDGEPEGLGGLEVDDQIELGGLLHWQIGGLRTLQDFVHINDGAAVEGRGAWSIRREAPYYDELSLFKNRREAIGGGR